MSSNEFPRGYPMRLTLRTLLAYRDGVLDEKDAFLLETKLKDSSTAQQISQRIDQGMANPKLAPIPVDAKEFGFDPNHIAEYLDDTIPVEQIPEMERKCLENNALLSEVGSCHRILTKAITQSVEIPADLHNRILALPSTPNAKPSKLQILRLGKDGKSVRIDAPVVGSFEAGKPSPTTESKTESVTKASIRPSPSEPRGSGIELNEGLGHQVPEYLVGQDRGWMKHVLLGGALIASLLMVAAYAIGPIEQLSSMLTNKADVEKTDNNEEPRQVSLPESKDVKEPLGQSDQKTEADAPTETSEKLSTVGPVETNDTDDKEPVADSSKVQGEKDIANVVTDKDEAKNSLPNGTTRPNSEVDSRPFPTGGLKWLPESKESSDSIVVLTTQTDQGTKQQLLEAGQKLTTGQILVPPLQRTEFVFDPGIKAIVAGETLLSLTPEQLPMAQFGRLILFPTPDSKFLSLNTPNGVLSLEFKTADSSCAMEISHHWAKTSNEEISSGKLKTVATIRLFGILGVVTGNWKRGDVEKALKLELGEMISIQDESISTTEMTTAPVWLRTSVEQHIDRFAPVDITKAISKAKDKALVEVLKEQANGRRTETASLAVRMLCLMGEYDSLFGDKGFLKRKGAYTHLKNWLAQMPNSVSISTNSEKLVASAKESLEGRFGALMRLLIVQSQDQFEEGGNRVLVEFLSSSQLDERVLAIVQLNEITGKTLGYHPDENSQDSIQQWRKLLSKDNAKSTQTN